MRRDSQRDVQILEYLRPFLKNVGGDDFGIVGIIAILTRWRSLEELWTVVLHVGEGFYLPCALAHH